MPVRRSVVCFWLCVVLFDFGCFWLVFSCLLLVALLGCFICVGWLLFFYFWLVFGGLVVLFAFGGFSFFYWFVCFGWLVLFALFFSFFLNRSHHTFLFSLTSCFVSVFEDGLNSLLVNFSSHLFYYFL